MNLVNHVHLVQLVFVYDVSTYVQMCTYLCKCTYVCTHIYVYVRTYVYLCTFVCNEISVYNCYAHLLQDFFFISSNWKFLIFHKQYLFITT